MKVVTKGWGPKSTLSNIPGYFERRKMEHRTPPKKKKREREKERKKERKRERKKERKGEREKERKKERKKKAVQFPSYY